MMFDEDQTMAQKYDIGTFWHGAELGEVQWLCLSSMVYHGHSVVIYSYSELDVPQGVELVDANIILDKKYLFRDRKQNNLAPFSDYFRLKMVIDTKKAWLDTDILLFCPVYLDKKYMFEGREYPQGRIVNNCILLPNHLNREIHLKMIDIIEDRKFATSHFNGIKKIKFLLRHYLSGNSQYSYLPWGALGYRILTPLVNKYGLDEFVIHKGSPEYIEIGPKLFEPMDNIENFLSDKLFCHFTTSEKEVARLSAGTIDENSVYAWARRKYL